MTILDTAYRCPRCQADRGNTPRDLPCPNCELTLDEAQEKVKRADPETKLDPDWLARQHRLAPLVLEHDRIAEQLTQARGEFKRQRLAEPEDPELDTLSERIQILSTEKARHFLQLVREGLKHGELPKLRRLIAEGRLPNH